MDGRKKYIDRECILLYKHGRYIDEMLKYINLNHRDCIIDLIKVINEKITDISLEKVNLMNQVFLRKEE